MCFFVGAWTYALAVNFIPAYRIPADKFSTTKIGIDNLATVVDEESGTESPRDAEKSGLASEKGDVEYRSPELETVQ